MNSFDKGNIFYTQWYGVELFPSTWMPCAKDSCDGYTPIDQSVHLVSQSIDQSVHFSTLALVLFAVHDFRLLSCGNCSMCSNLEIVGCRCVFVFCFPLNLWHINSFHICGWFSGSNMSQQGEQNSPLEFFPQKYWSEICKCELTFEFPMQFKYFYSLKLCHWKCQYLYAYIF